MVKQKTGFLEEIIYLGVAATIVGVMYFGSFDKFSKFVESNIHALEYNNTYHHAISIADDHYRYGNDNDFFDDKELEGMVKDLGGDYLPGEGIPLSDLERYIKMYK